MSITIQCPHCSKQLRLPNTDKVGKKVKCPKCSEPFKVELKPESGEINFDDFDSESAADNTPEPEEDAEESSPVERQSSRRGGKPAPKKRKKSGGVPMGALIGLIVGVGVLVSLIVGGVLLWPVIAANMTPKSPVDMTWLQADSNVLIHAKVSEITKSPFITKLKQTKFGQQMIAAAAKNPAGPSGISLENIESVTLATTLPSDLARKVTASQEQFFKSLNARFVLRLVEPMSEEQRKTLLGPTEYKSHGDAPYYIFKDAIPQNSPIGGTRIGVFQADEKTFIVASEADIINVIDQGRKPVYNALFSRIAPNPTFVLFIVNSDKNPPPGSSNPTSPSIRTSDPDAFSFSLLFDGTLTTSIKAYRSSDNTVAEVKAPMEKRITELKQSIDQFANSPMAMLAKDAVGVAKTLVDGIKISEEEDHVLITASVPDGLIALLDDPSKFAPLMMLTGGMGGGGMGGGGFGGPPPGAPSPQSPGIPPELAPPGQPPAQPPAGQ